MGWLKRLFGLEKPQNESAGEGSSTAQTYSVAPQPQAPDTPPERVGLNGEYDQSGLAKRVALAFDQDPATADLDHVYVAQTGSTVVLKGKVTSQDDLNKLVAIAKGVNGASGVESDQVTVG